MLLMVATHIPNWQGCQPYNGDRADLSFSAQAVAVTSTRWMKARTFTRSARTTQPKFFVTSRKPKRYPHRAADSARWSFVQKRSRPAVFRSTKKSCFKAKKPWVPTVCDTGLIRALLGHWIRGQAAVKVVHDGVPEGGIQVPPYVAD